MGRNTITCTRAVCDLKFGAQGIVMPPRVAPLQVIVIPIPAGSMTDAQRAELTSTTADLVAQLKQAGVRVQCDDRDNYRPGWKYNHWEVKVQITLPFYSPYSIVPLYSNYFIKKVPGLDGDLCGWVQRCPLRGSMVLI